MLVVAFVENTPPYPEVKQVLFCACEFNSGLRKTPSYSAHELLIEGVVAFVEEHGVQEATKGSKEKRPR